MRQTKENKINYLKRLEFAQDLVHFRFNWRRFFLLYPGFLRSEARTYKPFNPLISKSDQHQISPCNIKNFVKQSGHDNYLQISRVFKNSRLCKNQVKYDFKHLTNKTDITNLQSIQPHLRSQHCACAVRYSVSSFLSSEVPKQTNKLLF